jgi:hypothetical protein
MWIRDRQRRPATQRCFGVSRPRAGVEAVTAPGDPYGEPFGSGRRRTRGNFPELALSLGSPLYRPNTSYCNLV